MLSAARHRGAVFPPPEPTSVFRSTSERLGAGSELTIDLLDLTLPVGVLASVVALPGDLELPVQVVVAPGSTSPVLLVPGYVDRDGEPVAAAVWVVTTMAVEHDRVVLVLG